MCSHSGELDLDKKKSFEPYARLGPERTVSFQLWVATSFLWSYDEHWDTLGNLDILVLCVEWEGTEGRHLCYLCGQAENSDVAII